MNNQLTGDIFGPVKQVFDLMDLEEDHKNELIGMLTYSLYAAIIQDCLQFIAKEHITNKYTEALKYLTAENVDEIDKNLDAIYQGLLPDKKQQLSNDIVTSCGKVIDIALTPFLKEMDEDMRSKAYDVLQIPVDLRAQIV